VAIVCGFIRPGWGYQENYWLEELTKAGHEARIFIAGKESSAPESIAAAGGAYTRQAVKTWFGPRHNYFCFHVADALADFRPQIILWTGHLQNFGLDLLRDSRLRGAALVSLFGMNLGMHEYDWRKPGISLRDRLHGLGFHLLRGGICRRAARRSDRIIGNTPQTRGILLSTFRDPAEREAIDRKVVDLPLGFGPDNFRHDPELRATVRQALGLAPDDLVVAMSSRFAAGQKFRFLNASIRGILAALERHPTLKAVIIGFTDNDVSDHFRRLIAADPNRNRVIQHPFADLTQLNGLYNAADLAVFGNASISCQAALGTGLTVCLADNGTMNHLITVPNQGFFFPLLDIDAIADQIVRAAQVVGAYRGDARVEFRRRLAEAASWLSYEQIMRRVIELASPFVQVA
jgi:glycosyltransferase involved in cell wall biosynthesis